MDSSTPGLTIHQQLPELAQNHIHGVGDAIHLSQPSPSAFNLSQHQGLFQKVSSSHRWPNSWNFSFRISPSNEYPGLIFYRIDWFVLLAVRGTLKTTTPTVQHHSSKASILQCSAFLMIEISHPYMTTRKIIALTRWAFVGKLMSLLFNMLSR